MQDKHEAAETFFEAATSVEPKAILPWTMFGRLMLAIARIHYFGEAAKVDSFVFVH